MIVMIAAATLRNGAVERLELKNDHDDMVNASVHRLFNDAIRQIDERAEAQGTNIHVLVITATDYSGEGL